MFVWSNITVVFYLKEENIQALEYSIAFGCQLIEFLSLVPNLLVQM